MKILKKINYYWNKPCIRADIGIPAALIIGMTIVFLENV